MAARADVEELPGKKTVQERLGQKRIKALQFGLLSNQDIVAQSVVEIQTRHLYNLSGGDRFGRSITKNGPLDPRLGTSNKIKACETCHRMLKDCNGHFGYVKLALPVFHVGFFRKIVDILNCICKECAGILLEGKEQQSYHRKMQRRNLDNLQHNATLKQIITDCRKCHLCPHCGAVNGPIRRVSGHALKVIHDKFRWFQTGARAKHPLPEYRNFEASFKEARKTNPDIGYHMKKAVDDLTPLRVLNLFRRIKTVDCTLLGLDPFTARPELLILQYVPAPPVSARPSVTGEGSSTEDDLTNKIGDIVHINSLIKGGIQNGHPVYSIMEHWDYLQIQVAMYINSDVPNLQQSGFGKPIRGLCQRLKGKQGRFRGNLSGKRVDYSSRTVISPDPNVGIHEVAVPDRVAVTLTYPERVNRYNIDSMRELVRRGKRHPGANFITKKTPKRRVWLEILQRKGQDALDKEADNLQIGDVVERHLVDGDIVLFNRQPSLHKLSIMCHRVKVREWRTFRLNECVCTPYNADFDGDEMNLHVPQTEAARSEALELMGVKYNLCTPKDGTPIIAATQDFITAAYMMCNRDRFYDRKTFVEICSYMFDGDAATDTASDHFNSTKNRRLGFTDVELPAPAILKPQCLWTGKQVFSVLMKPTKTSKVSVDFDAPCKQWSSGSLSPYKAEEDTWLCIRKSEIMSGVLDKYTLGAGRKDSLFYVIMRDFGPDSAVQAMNRMAKLFARWLGNEGFSIGINDVSPGRILAQQKATLVETAYDNCESLIVAYRDGRLGRDAGCDEDQTLEKKIQGELNRVREAAGALCLKQLSNRNAAIIMAQSGSKGSNLNVAQMVATVGQQSIGGSRVADGFQDRTLPHFPKAARQPLSKGFVRNSFFSGLNPPEFIFHAMSGREGLVDTAVKTAETGYMSRRLMKTMEDLSQRYDNSVRNANSNIVQFRYGDDGLDPVDMEGKAKPVNFERTFVHAQSLTWYSTTSQEAQVAKGKKRRVKLERGPNNPLPAEDVTTIMKTLLTGEYEKYQRKSLMGIELKYHTESDNEVDQYESYRVFLADMEDFVTRKADLIAAKPQTLTNGTTKISETCLRKFIELCLEKYHRAKVESGHAVGAVGAQSIGEPGTQMTLKTFHHAGIAGMSITQGVPRIKEIINGSKIISTPVISCQITSNNSERAARLVKSAIEKTYLKDILSRVTECWNGRSCFLRLNIDFRAVSALDLDLNINDIGRALVKARGIAIDRSSIRIVEEKYIHVYLLEKTGRKKNPKLTTKEAAENPYVRLQNLKRLLPEVVVKGCPSATRAVVSRKALAGDDKKPQNELLVQGYGFRACMNTDGVESQTVRTNSVIETMSVLGIEAARATIITELQTVIASQLDIDPRHIQLLADVMTCRGEVYGITRFGLAKTRDSVLHLASFEKTPDHLFEAGIRGKQDKIEGVSECIIMGQSIKIGTGSLGVVRKFADIDFGSLGRGLTVFDNSFRKAK